MTLSSDQFLYLMYACIAGLCIGWVSLFVSVRKQPEVLSKLFTQGYFLRMITVALIVVCVGVLVVVDKLNSEASTILAGIAGFVLGGMRNSKIND